MAISAVTTRSEVLERAIASFSALDGVDAIYLSGSLAEQTDDQYSDIDLRVVIVDSSYEAVRALRAHLPTTWGPFLFNAAVAEIHTVSYYESLTKADVFYFASSALAPSPWFNLGTRILLDRSGHLASVLEVSKGLHFTIITPHEIVDHFQKCVAALAEGAKRVQRGEPIYGSRLCAEGVHYLLAAEDLLSCRAPFGSSKRERLVPGNLTELARASIGVPAVADSESYFSALSTRLQQLVSRAESEGHCDRATASRLLAALDQLISLAGGR
jgi:predicted nucleotidyltransferase